MSATTRRMFRWMAALTASSVAACAVGPGPIEQQVSQNAMLCQQVGNQLACDQWRNLAPFVEGERAQRATENNATAGLIAAGLLGVVAGVAVGASSSRGGYYHSHRSHYRYR